MDIDQFHVSQRGDTSHRNAAISSYDAGLGPYMSIPMDVVVWVVQSSSTSSGARDTGTSIVIH